MKASESALRRGGGTKAASSRFRDPLPYVAGLVVAALLALGGWLVSGQSTGTIPGFEKAEDRPLLAEAGEGAARIATLKLEGRGDIITFARAEGGWRLADSGGYPLSSGRVDSLLEQLGTLSGAYVSSESPPPYDDFGLTDVADPTGTTVRITAEDGAGAVLGRLTLGNIISAPGGGINRKLTAVTREGDPHIWLAPGQLRLSADPLEWLNNGILDTAPEQVTEVTVAAPDGERLVVRRDGPGGEFFVAEGLPPDGVEQPWLLEELAALPHELVFVNVRPARDLGTADQPWHTQIKTVDGITYHAALHPGETGTWAVFEAEATEPAARERAAGFNARHGNWAYLLEEYRGQRFMTRPEELAQAP